MVSDNSIEHKMVDISVSEKPRSDYTSADYSLEQWHNACLIHEHDGAPTSKSQCKLPVKTPMGVVNRNGVHAAAAALAGARGGVKTSEEEKASARRKLISLYNKLDETPPPSLNHTNAADLLLHSGIKGMKWGTRRTRKELAKNRQGASGEAKAASKALAKAKISGPQALSNKELQALNNRLNLEQSYSRLSYSPGKLKKGLATVTGILVVGKTLNEAVTFSQSPVGKKIAASLGSKAAKTAAKAATP